MFYETNDCATFKTMSLHSETEPANNSGYGSSDETASLLVVTTTKNETPTNSSPVASIGSSGAISGGTSGNFFQQTGKMSSINGPTGTKPILQRQDRTSTYLVSPQLSQTKGTSEESAGTVDGEEYSDKSIVGIGTVTCDNHNTRSVPDIDIQCKLETPIISVSNVHYREHDPYHYRSTAGYHNILTQRCRPLRSCDRRASTAPVSSLQLARSISKESVRSHNLFSRVCRFMHEFVSCSVFLTVFINLAEVRKIFYHLALTLTIIIKLTQPSFCFNTKY